MLRMKFILDDGGRKAAGFKGLADDCVCRAVSIATKLPYKEIYDLINEISKSERTGKNKSSKSSARLGVYKYTQKRLLKELGWIWTPTMKIGKGCQVHLCGDELPKGRLVVSVSKHICAVINGVLHDTHDCSRGGKRCVYGFWTKGKARW